jgi:hypothetical protein
MVRYRNWCTPVACRMLQAEQARTRGAIRTIDHDIRYVSNASPADRSALWNWCEAGWKPGLDC